MKGLYASAISRVFLRFWNATLRSQVDEYLTNTRSAFLNLAILIVPKFIQMKQLRRIFVQLTCSMINVLVFSQIC